ncbi:MAG: SDR family oxidoreductase [Candidatus Thermoplasmatota archaeon]|nr:SDR family oxidoreductase [Candidatus Thermoplasmatota archaeon]
MELKDKICMVTGANSGIGKRTAERFADTGAKVVMLCRDKERGEKARNDLVQKTQNENIELLLCDLSSMRSVRRAAKGFKENYSKLHVLVNNAGLISSSKKITEEGNEKTFATNYLGHFLLTYLLIDPMKEASSAEIINVTSAAHKSGELDFDDLQLKRSTYFSGWKAYANSKLAQVMFTYTLSRKLKKTTISVNSYHPGVVNSHFGKKTFLTKIFYKLFFFLMRDPDDSAEDIVRLITDPEFEDSTGKYFSKGKIKKSSKESYDVEARRKLWKESKKLVGI